MARFRPGRTLSILTLVGCLILAALGTWQARKIGPKTDLLATIEAGLAADPIPLHDLDAPVAYRRVEITPIAVARTPVTVFGTNKDGKPGYHLYTLITTNRGVNLVASVGWISFEDKGDLTLSLGEPFPVAGVLVPSPRPGLMTPANAPERGEWHLADVDQIARHYGVSHTYPMRFIADSWPPNPRFLGGQVRVDIPNNHREYALTWFGLMASLIGVYVAFGISRGRQDTS